MGKLNLEAQKYSNQAECARYENFYLTLTAVYSRVITKHWKLDGGNHYS